MCWLVWGRAFKCVRRLQRYKFLTDFADIQFTRKKNEVSNVLVVLRISEKLFEYLTEVTRVEWNVPRLFPSASLETIYFNSRNKARIFNSFPSLHHFKICQPQNICSGHWLLLTQNLIFQMHRPSKLSMSVKLQTTSRADPAIIIVTFLLVSKFPWYKCISVVPQSWGFAISALLLSPPTTSSSLHLAFNPIKIFIPSSGVP